MKSLSVLDLTRLNVTGGIVAGSSNRRLSWSGEPQGPVQGELPHLLYVGGSQ
jgi:hypothetical protein